MNLILVYQYFIFPTSRGGTRPYDIATSFVKKNYNVQVLTTSSSFADVDLKRRWNYIEREGLKLHVLKLDYRQDLSKLRRILVFLKFLVFASIKILQLKGDLVIASSTPLTIGVPALIKKWIQGTPFIFEVRDVWPEAVIAIGAIRNKFIHALLYKLEGLIYSNASAIVPLSVDMKNSITSRYPNLNDKPIKVIENISEITRFQNGYEENISILDKKIGFTPRFSILYAGTFGQVNGLKYVVDLAALTKGKDDSIVFVLLGKGAKKEEVKSYAAEKRVLNHNLFVLDPVSKNELPQLYFEASMGSSYVIQIEELWANSANKFFDSLAAGKPIMINHGGWQKDVIESQDVGYVLPPKLNSTVIEDFIAYTHDVERIRKQEENALVIAKEKYSLERAIEIYQELLERTISSSR